MKYEIQWIYTVNIFTMTQFLNRDVSNIVNINVFLQLFVNFEQVWVKLFDINHVVKKVICLIFNVYFFDLSHLKVH